MAHLLNKIMPEPNFGPEKPPKKEVERRELQEAKEILKEDFLGPEAVEKAFGIKLSPEEIPEIPFSKEDLEKAKELGQFLILRADKAPDGEPLTMKKMDELLQPTFNKENEGKILFNTDWYENEDFSTKETPQARWSLVSKEAIPDSLDKNYLEQTETLVEYIEKNIDSDTIPEYSEAIKKFNDQKEEIKKLIRSDWKKAAEKLVELKINKLTRQTPAEVLYDILIYKQNNGKRLLENRHTWTSRRDSSGRLVRVGPFNSEGVWVSAWGPGRRDSELGFLFSRSV